MKRFLLLTLSLFAFYATAQQDQQTEFKPNTICWDHQVPFFQVTQEKENFSFMLFNRWGQLLFETDDPMFLLERDFNEKNRTHFKENDVYTFLLKYQKDGEQKEVNGNFVFIGYCNEG